MEKVEWMWEGMCLSRGGVSDVSGGSLMMSGGDGVGVGGGVEVLSCQVVWVVEEMEGPFE